MAKSLAKIATGLYSMADLRYDIEKVKTLKLA